MKNIYQNLYRKKSISLVNIGRINQMLKIINRLKLKHQNILDIGCNNGELLSKIKNHNNLFGLDASQHALSKIKNKNIKTIHLFLDEKNCLPYKDNQFSLVIAGEIIEHIYDTDHFLTEIKRVIKPGGRLLLSTPNIASLGRRLLLLLGISPLIEDSPNNDSSVGHIRYFTFGSLSSLLIKHHLFPQHFQSDLVNFNHRGNIKSQVLAKIFPTIGQSIIVLCQKALN